MKYCIFLALFPTLIFSQKSNPKVLENFNLDSAVVFKNYAEKFKFPIIDIKDNQTKKNSDSSLIKIPNAKLNGHEKYLGLGLNSKTENLIKIPNLVLKDPKKLAFITPSKPKLKKIDEKAFFFPEKK